MEPDYYKMATDLIDTGIGEEGRLQFILECINKNKPLYKTDKIFLESCNNKLEAKIKLLQKNPVSSAKTVVKVPKPKTNSSRTLLSDEHLDKHLDELDNNKSKSMTKPAVEKKSFFKRIFSSRKK